MDRAALAWLVGGTLTLVRGSNGDQNGFRTYLTLCPDQHVGSLLAFNTETRAVSNSPANRETPESRVALAAGKLCEALASPRK